MEPNYWADHEEQWIEATPRWVEEYSPEDIGGGFIRVPLQRVPFHIEDTKKVIRVAASVTATSVTKAVIRGIARANCSSICSSYITARLSSNAKAYKDYRRKKDEETILSFLLSA